MTETAARRPAATPAVLVAVAAGGAVGVALRLGVGSLLPVAPLPWATLAVNVVGSLCLGVVVARASRHRRTGLSLPFLGPGLLGSFTTYSTFAVETNWLLATRPAVGASYAIASLVGGVAAARWGYRLGRW